MEIATPFTVFVLLSSFLSSLHGKLTTCSSFYFFSRRRFPQVKRRGCLHCPFTDQRTEKLRNPFIFLEGGGGGCCLNTCQRSCVIHRDNGPAERFYRTRKIYENSYIDVPWGRSLSLPPIYFSTNSWQLVARGETTAAPPPPPSHSSLISDRGERWRNRDLLTSFPFLVVALLNFF